MLADVAAELLEMVEAQLAVLKLSQRTAFRRKCLADAGGLLSQVIRRLRDPDEDRTAIYADLALAITKAGAGGLFGRKRGKQAPRRIGRRRHPRSP